MIVNKDRIKIGNKIRSIREARLFIIKNSRSNRNKRIFI